MPSSTTLPLGRPPGRRDMAGRALRVRDAHAVGLAYQAKVGMAVREMRESLEVSQRELAAAAGVSLSAIYRLEVGRPRRPGARRYVVGRRWWVNLDVLRRVAGALGVRVSDLLPGG